MTKPVKFEAHIYARRAWLDGWLATRTQEEGDCLLWTGCMNSGGTPKATIAGDRDVHVRRLVYSVRHGSIPAGHEVVPTCRTPRCLACLSAMTPRQRLALHVQAGAYSSPSVCAVRRAAARARSPHSAEQVKAVRSLRAQGLTHDAIAEATGIKKKTVAKYCNGTRRAEAANGASVFSWGGLAA